MIRRILAIAKKEVRQIKRDKRMLYVLFIFPFILLVIFGYAINFDVHHIKMFVYDQDKTVDSREFVNRLTSSNYFDIEGYLNSEKEIRGVLDKGDAQVVLVFPREFSKDIHSGRDAQVQILVEGVNANTASIVSNYMNVATASFSHNVTSKILARKGRKANLPLDVESRFWFNSDLNSTRYLIPGLISMILIITAVVSISLSLVREKERGTIEQINVSPLSSMELLVGKTIPYTVISLVIAAIILVAGYFLFGVAIKGSLILLFFSTFIFLFAALNLGIFVSAISDSQQVAFQISTMVSLLPTFILSGFVFPDRKYAPCYSNTNKYNSCKIFYNYFARDFIKRGWIKCLLAPAYLPLTICSILSWTGNYNK